MALKDNDALAVLIVLDTLVSVVAIQGCSATEVNPVCAWLLSFGLPVFLGVKLLVAGAAYRFLPARMKWGRVVLWALVAAVSWNVVVLALAL